MYFGSKNVYKCKNRKFVSIEIKKCHFLKFYLNRGHNTQVRKL